MAKIIGESNILLLDISQFLKLRYQASCAYTIYMTLVLTYIRWHFGMGLQEIYEFWKNLSWFGYHFFSISLLCHTLFRPLYRIHESTPPGAGLNLELFFENITINLMARMIGFLLRAFLIICGLCYQIIILILGALCFLLWLFLPILPFILILQALRLIF